MPGGLLQLAAYGPQDVYLTGNPEITFFIAIAGLLILYLDANDTYTCRIVQLFGVKGWERK